MVTLGRALAHPARIEILRLIGRKKLSVTDVASRLGVQHAVVSYHLAKLYDAGLVTFKKVGRCHYYRRSCDAFLPLMAPL